jgi:hypothetical protein
MFFQLLYIHLFRPFLKYSQATSPLPANVSPRRLCTQAAEMISKLMRLYRRSHGLRQICNVTVYILHTACTIHLLNLPDKNSRRDITHGLKHLEEIAESWLCARRTLAILGVLCRKWKVELPEDASSVLSRAETKYGTWGTDLHSRTPSHKSESMSPALSPLTQALQPTPTNYFNPATVSTSMGADPTRRPSSNSTLPPQSAADLQRTRMYSSQAASTPPMSRRSIDSTITPAGGSPSALFGGVDQLLRDSQDWWLKDQSQLAMGFEQWPIPEADWLAVSSGPAPAVTSVLGTGAYATVPDGFGGVGPVNGLNGNGNGTGVIPLLGTEEFGVLNQYPNENEWYA